MFSKSKQSPENAPATPQRNYNNVRNSSGHTFSVIASDVEIVGNLTARVDLHVEGKVQGEEIVAAPEEAPKAQIIDLMEALKAI